MLQPLTPDEEKVRLSIIGKTDSEGISGGIDLLGDEGLSTYSEEEEEPSGSRVVTCTSPGALSPRANQQGPASACGEA